MPTTCPECGVRFSASHHRALFCSPAHQRAFNNRKLARGQVLVGLAQTWRGGRSGSPEDRDASKDAFSEFCRIVSDYNAEDAKAGRPRAVSVYRRQKARGLL